MASPEFSYVGSELALFQSARNWKSYYGGMVKGFLGSNVLEVGAGIGGTTQSLCNGEQESWVCLEPDQSLCTQIAQRLDRGELPSCCIAVNGSLGDLSLSHVPDTILYMDVLEHISEDREELARASALLEPGGYIVVLAPAHNWLFSAFDKAVGHHRRYTKATLNDITPPDTEVVMERYMDSCGTCLSLANKLLTKQSMPTQTNIKFWDSCVVPFSKLVDRLLGYRFGKSVLMVWQKRPINASESSM